MKLVPLGESAFIIRDLGRWDSFALSDAVGGCRLPGVLEAVCAYDTVAVYVDSETFELEPFERWLKGAEPTQSAAQGREHVVPVCYELGEDLEATASLLGLTAQNMIECHCSVAYRCFAVGFSPGFPYLGYLPEALQGVPRRPSPRVRVPAGSVAITGSQTGVYPQETPGGWALIGRTPCELVDPRQGYFAFQAGDVVRFTSISLDEFHRHEGERI
jgi:KipI family sensor histidine kinase inhibitor